jgi:SET domain-containing protein
MTMEERAELMSGSGLISVRASGIHGLGCYAAAEIPAGTVVIEYRGESIDRAEALRRDDRGRPGSSPYVLSVTEDLYIDGAVGGNEARFINHSCEPNCRVRRVGGRAWIVAARTITEGEELSFDYDYEGDPQGPCRCGARTCRGSL